MSVPDWQYGISVGKFGWKCDLIVFSGFCKWQGWNTFAKTSQKAKHVGLLMFMSLIKYKCNLVQV